MKIKPLFAWYDCWIGIYWDRQNKTLYIMPIPMFGIKILCHNHFCIECGESCINAWMANGSTICWGCYKGR